MSDNYGTPYFAFLTPSIVSYDTIGVWEVKVNGELIDGSGKDLITIINDLKTKYGIYSDTTISPPSLMVKNISALDHNVSIKYTGDQPINFPREQVIGNVDVLITDSGLTAQLSLGGFNAATCWVYPNEMQVETYATHDNETAVHMSGNTYVIEVDNVAYFDKRDLVPSSDRYGSLHSIIQQNNLGNILKIESQAPIAGNFHNYQIVNIDIVPHVVKCYVNQNKPFGNKNTVAGTATEVYKGRAIYCKDDAYNISPTFGSVNNRVVDDKGFTMTLAKASIPTLVLIHSPLTNIDTRSETIITINGSVTSGNVSDYKGEIPDVSVVVTIGNDNYYPDISNVDNVVTWELSVSSNVFINNNTYIVTASRLGGINGYHVKTQYVSPTILRAFTKYDVLAQITPTTTNRVNSGTFTIPNTYTPEQLTAMTYEAGTRSGTEIKTVSIVSDSEVITFNDFVTTWLSDNTDDPIGTVNVLKRRIGEVGIYYNQAQGGALLDLISLAETPLPTPLYDLNQYDYSYVAVTGLGSALFENSMFSNWGAGQCHYIPETDTNVWIMRY